MEATVKRDHHRKWVGPAIGLLICILLWVFSDSQWMKDLTVYITAELDQMKDVVLKLMGISSVSSTALTLIPDDVATPLAENIADVSDYLIIVFIGLWVQRYLFSTMSIIALKFLIPGGIILHFFPKLAQELGLDRFLNSQMIENIGKKIMLFGTALFLVVPTTIFLTNKIEDTYQTTINQTIEQAEQIQNEVEEDAKPATENVEDTPTDFLGIVGDFFSNTVDGVVNFTSEALGKLSETIQALPNKMTTTLNNLINSLAILIVVNCIAPILIFIFLIWLIKMLFAIDLNPKVQQVVLARPFGNFRKYKVRKFVEEKYHSDKK